VLEDWPEYASADLWEMKGIKGVGQANALTTMRENPRGSYFLTGYYNRGKTHLLVAQYRHIALLGERCIIRSARDLMDELRKAEIPPQSDKDVFESAVLQMVNMAPTGHLFIDDIDKITARSEFRLEALFDLFDTIKRRQLGLTVTSNIPLISNSQSIQDLRNILGNNAVSRLDRICRVIDL
jgi:DNA replication protein DnaC